MNEEYLWDRTGPPDPQIERLERTLMALRCRRPAIRGEAARSLQFRGHVACHRIGWAAAAVVAGVAVGLLALPGPQVTRWRVAGLEGTARLGARDATVSMAVRPGQVVRTGRDAQLTLEAGEFGRIDLGPDSELRAATDRRLLLRRGELHAFIWSPPREFVVETASARAVDLGCEYTIAVDPAGNGLLRVATGWVAFQFAGRESFIPAGAACVTRKREGPGVPFYEDAPATLRAALADFERGDGAALGRILAAARTRDALTLWHLLTRVPAPDRGAVFDRFARLVALPPGVSRDAVLRRDPHAIDLCWNALNLENTGWWRGWERNW